MGIYIKIALISLEEILDHHHIVVVNQNFTTARLEFGLTENQCQRTLNNNFIRFFFITKFIPHSINFPCTTRLASYSLKGFFDPNFKLNLSFFYFHFMLRDQLQKKNRLVLLINECIYRNCKCIFIDNINLHIYILLALQAHIK